MKKEISIGLFAIIGLVIIIWGYKYLLGQNLLKASKNYKIEYRDVDGLEASSPVFFRGLQVGTVTDIIPSADYRKLVVTIAISDNSFTPPSNSVANLKGSVMGGKTIELVCTGPCSSEPLPSGSLIIGQSLGLIGSMVDDNELDALMKNIQSGVGGIIDSLNAKIRIDGDSTILNSTIHDIQLAVSNLRVSTYYLSNLLATSSSQISSTFSNLESVSKNLHDNNEIVSQILQNFADISGKLKNAPIDSTFEKVDLTLSTMNNTVKNLDGTFQDLDHLIEKLNQPKGSLGMLINDQNMYVQLEESLRQLRLLLQDVRLHPKRYVNVSVFGKKEKPYKYPEDDPARQDTMLLEESNQ